jgi:hypothetical protein
MILSQVHKNADLLKKASCFSSIHETDWLTLIMNQNVLSVVQQNDLFAIFRQVKNQITKLKHRMLNWNIKWNKISI